MESEDIRSITAMTYRGFLILNFLRVLIVICYLLGKSPGVHVALIADFSELSVGSILIGRWMRNDWGPGVRYIYTEKVCSREVVGPMGGEWLKEVDTSSVRWRGGKVYIRVAAVELQCWGLAGWTLSAMCLGPSLVLQSM